MINYSRRDVTIAAESGKYIHQEVTTEPETIKVPTDPQVSPAAGVEITSPTDKVVIKQPFVYHISDEGKRLDSRKIGSLTDRWDFEGDEDEQAPRFAPCFGGGVVLGRLVKPEAINELGDLLSRFRVSVRNRRTVSEVAVGSARDETTAGQTEPTGMVVEKTEDANAPIVRNRRTAKISKPQALVRYRVTKVRFQAGRQAEKLRARMLQSLAIQQACFEADGGMMGLECGEQAEGRVEESTEVQTSQQAGANGPVETEGGMVGLEAQEPVTNDLEVTDVLPSQQTADGIDQVMSGAEVAENAGDGDEELVDADSTKIEQADEVDEVMIGSDVEAAMEVDDGNSNSDGDSGFVEGDSMRLEADGPQLEGNQAGSPDSMDIERQDDRGKVNKEKLLDKIRREKEEIRLRQASTDAAKSGEMISGSGGALAQSSQQHAAPVSTLETGNAAAGMLGGVAQNLESTNTSEDLREARRGKRPESRAVPREVAGPSPLPGPRMAEDGDTSDTTQPTMTPASTLPSSLSSTPPASPLPRNTASAHDGSPKPASAKGEGRVPKKEDRKRGRDSLGDSSDDEEASGGSEKAKVSTRKRVLLAKTVRRRVPTVPDSGSSNSSRPETTYPAESSKGVQQKRPEKAESDGEIVPLNDIPDKALTSMFIIQRDNSPAPNQHHVCILLDPFETILSHQQLFQGGVLTWRITEEEKEAQFRQAVWDLFEDHSDEE